MTKFGKALNYFAGLTLLCVACSSHADTSVSWAFDAQPDANPATAVPLMYSAADTDGIGRDVTVTAYSIDAVDGPLTNSRIVNISGTGLGACNAQDEPAACSAPLVGIDNVGFDDGVLLEFDGPIDALDIEVSAVVGGQTLDAEITVFIGRGAFDIAFDFDSRFDDLGVGSRTIALTLDEPIDWVMVAPLNDTGGAQDNDYFHIVSATASPFCSASEDIDMDGVANMMDNCVYDSNAPQRDTDADGFGNVCDADLDNNGVANAADLGIFKAVFFTPDADADFNGDGIVNAQDLGVLKARFFTSPGPSCVTVGTSGDAPE